MANPWRFAAGYSDSSTGLYKFGTRYYNPGFGRWSQQDPLRGQLNDPTSLNRYVYVGDDPVNLTDPSGRDSLITACLVGAGLAFIGALVAFLLELISGGTAIPLIVIALGLFFQGLIGELANLLIAGCITGVAAVILAELVKAFDLPT